MRKKSVYIVATIFVQFWAIHATAAPPKVVKAVPDNGDVDVDPSLTEIRITFDQPMGEGMSVVGGGEQFPEVQGQPRWATQRTIVVRVKAPTES